MKSHNEARIIETMACLLIADPKDEYTRYHYAMKLQEKRRFAEAEEQYQSILIQNPHHFKALHQFGILLSNTKRYEESAEYFRKEIALNPDGIKGHNSLGYTYYLMDRPADAVKCYNEAISLWETDPAYVPDSDFMAIDRNGNRLNAGNQIALTYYNKALAHLKLQGYLLG